MTDEKKPSRAELGERAFRGLGGRVPRPLVHGGHATRHLALDDRYLYWTDDATHELSRMPKGGGGSVVLAQPEHPGYVTLVGGHLYWTQRDMDFQGAYPGQGGPPRSVVRMPVDGGPVEVVAAGLDAPNEIAVSGDDVAISCDGQFEYHRKEEPRGLIVRTTLGGSKPRVVATKQRRPESLAFVDDDLYWVNQGWKWPDYFADGALLRMKRHGDTKRWIVRKNQPMAGSLLVDDAYLYWITTPTLVDRTLVGAIYRRPRRGGATTVVTRVFDLDGALLAQDATHLYWISGSRGSMYRVAKTGGAPEPMMTCDERFVLARSLVVDDHRVYWTVSDGASVGGAVWSMGKDPAGLRAPDDAPTERPN